PYEEKNEEDRSKFDDLRESSISVRNLDELIDENHVIFSGRIRLERDLSRNRTEFHFLSMFDLYLSSQNLCCYLFSANNYTTKSGRETNHSNLSTPNLLFNCPSSKVVTVKPCLWNGMKRLCYLFARKFYPEALHNLMQLFSNDTLI
ncbi:unnamed protein product, partial [Musa acuminata var. zebrina]